MAIVAPLLAYIYPPPGKVKKIDLPVTLDTPLGDLPAGQAVRFDAPPQAGFIMQNGGGDNGPGKVAFGGYAVKNGSDSVVFAVNCSHLGCSINFNGSAKRFECPCHGSIFAINGDVIHGPAQAPLSNLAWKQGNDPKTILIQGYSGLT